MNVNPHLQYLQQQQQQQQQQQSQPLQSNQSQSNQSPQFSQLQLQQLQRQQLLNQHLQQQQLQLQLLQVPPQLTQQLMGTPTSTNPLLAVLNGGANSNATSTGNGSLSSNPVLQQLQLQQLQQQVQLQQLQAQQQQQQQQAIPIIKEVWSSNLEHEFQALRTFINDKTSKVFIAIHQEIPGIVARPVGTFKSSSDYHFQTLRANSDLLNLIQLSLCVIKISKNETISTPVIWQFNFLYDLTKEMYNEEHLAMLAQTSQINFQLLLTHGIPHFEFAELMIESGLILDDNINWVSFHAGYDLGFFVSLLLNDDLPVDEPDFYWWCAKYFPNFYDLKYIGNQILNKSTTNGAGGTNSNTLDEKTNKPSIEYLAEELHLLPISPAIRQHFTNSTFHSQQLTSTLHAYLSMECFKELLRRSNMTLLSRFKGTIWGLGTFSGGTSINNTNNNGVTEDEIVASRINGISTPSTPVGIISKSGMVHFGGRV